MKIMESESLHGQLFDYMQRLKSFFGQQWVFGIATTYDQWRIYWLPDCDPVARQTKVGPPKKKHEISLVPTPLQSIPSLQNDEKEGNDSNPTVSELQRVLHGTKVLAVKDGQALPIYLASAIWKMYCSPTIEVELVDINRHYIQLQSNTWFWNTLPNNFTLKFGVKIPSRTTQNLFLVHDLGGGIHGRVWLAASRTGIACVLKFAHEKSSAGFSMLEQECNIWEKIWKLPAKLISLNKDTALMMPFVKPCSESDWINNDVLSAVREAIKKLANHGYEHDDLHRRHVGLYEDKKEHLHAVLFDLAKMKKIQNKDNKKNAVRAMMATLNISSE